MPCLHYELVRLSWLNHAPVWHILKVVTSILKVLQRQVKAIK